MISTTTSWDSETFLNKYFLSWSFVLCTAGSLGQVKNMIKNILYFSPALKIFPCCLLSLLVTLCYSQRMKNETEDQHNAVKHT